MQPTEHRPPDAATAAKEGIFFFLISETLNSTRTARWTIVGAVGAVGAVTGGVTSGATAAISQIMDMDGASQQSLMNRGFDWRIIDFS